VTAPNTPIVEALRILEDSRLQILMITDEAQRLLGIVTDGDIRRAILRGDGLDDPIDRAMVREPLTTAPEINRLHLLKDMMRLEIRRVPVLDETGRVIDLIGVGDLTNPEPLENIAVLMVGGLGTRLGPLTATTPKPMVPVGHRPVLETILTQLKLYGFRRIFLAVNHRAQVIEAYFGDGRALDLEIAYLREEERLGTAGPLRLLPERPAQPLLVMNGDLLTKLNFRELLNFHAASKASATMCLGEHSYEVPYGVAKVDGDRLVSMREKPVQHFRVNAGIYVLNPAVFDLVPAGGACDMPALIDSVLERGERVSAYPIRDYWFDIGRLEDLQQANTAAGQP
jgi:dTDP-glucose pyrophosphorylase